MDADTIAWVRTLARRVSASEILPFEYVVEASADHPDADLAAAWNAPVVAINATFSTDYLVTLAHRVDRVATRALLQEYASRVAVDALRGEPPEVVEVIRNAIAAINSTHAQHWGTRAYQLWLSPSLCADVSTLARALEALLLRDDAGLSFSLLTDAYAKSAGPPGARRSSLPFVKRFTVDLRKRIAAPTWRTLCGEP